MAKKRLFQGIAALISVMVLAWLFYQLPPVKERLSWRIDFALTYLRGMAKPVDSLPTPLAQSGPSPTASLTPIPLTPTPTPTALPDLPSPTPTFTPTPRPESASLPAPTWEQQDINNCGPASLAMHLRMFGWQGDQFDISAVIKPVREDRNVNVEELAYYVRTQAGWLNILYRVGGTLEQLKSFIAAGLPVMIEESFIFEEPFWPNDDLWAAHYQLLTGYDDAAGVFTAQDSYYGADQRIAYAALDENWKIFNRVYILLYLPQQETLVRELLGEDWEVDTNRRKALAAAQAEVEANPEDAYAWFNIGTNQVYFEQYGQAAEAYDQARTFSLPQRMLRYQFGPFFAYFHTGRIDELMALTGYALERTPNAEEALLWHGWGLYRQGDTNGAIADWQAALEANPNYLDARYALDFVGAAP